MSRRLLPVLALALVLGGCTRAPAAPAATPAPTVTPMPTATPAPAVTPEPTPDPEEAMVDLTSLSATMVFAEVAAMARTPEHYLDKTVRMQGELAVYPANPALGIDAFYTVVIRDATACCQQGLEFVWDGGTLPEPGTELRVTGTFAAYDCGGLPSYHIVADTVEILS
ncbi:hypothetical protein [uncultured Subdoligranulum sp.]|uniref:hypothetical protein n=1 Tax=uncultured Subdoligranulum sp. TaxID=512298 RepID=UPI0025DB1A67|nr:hypothetical protein [uncultured Subdoligranulum sp.]